MSRFTTLTSTLALAIFAGGLSAAMTSAIAQACACSSHQGADVRFQHEAVGLNPDGTGLTRFEDEHIKLIAQYGRPHIAGKFRARLRQLPNAAARALFTSKQLTKIQMAKKLADHAAERKKIEATSCITCTRAAVFALTGRLCWFASRSVRTCPSSAITTST